MRRYMHQDARKREKAALRERVAREDFHHQRRMRKAKTVLSTRLDGSIRAVRRSRKRREKQRSKLVWKGQGRVVAPPKRGDRPKSPSKVCGVQFSSVQFSSSVCCSVVPVAARSNTSASVLAEVCVVGVGMRMGMIRQRDSCGGARTAQRLRSLACQQQLTL